MFLPLLFLLLQITFFYNSISIPKLTNITAPFPQTNVFFLAELPELLEAPRRQIHNIAITVTKIIWISAYGNRACHSQSEGNGICLAVFWARYHRCKQKPGIHTIASAPAVTGSVFLCGDSGTFLRPWWLVSSPSTRHNKSPNTHAQ